MKSKRKSYTVTATRSEGWWVVNVTGVPKAIIWTQARRLDQVETTARDAISGVLETEPDAFDLDITYDLGDELAEQLAKTKAITAQAERSQAEAQKRMKEFARLMRDRGYTVRDTGRLMELSPQRISQLLND